MRDELCATWEVGSEQYHVDVWTLRNAFTIFVAADDP